MLVLRRFLPPSVTAVAVAAGYGSVAFAFGRRALERIEEAAPATVERKIEEKKEEMTDSLKERVSAPPG